MAILIPCKRKHRPGNGEYFWAKKNGAAGDHQGGKRRRKTGVNTYDRNKHIMVLQKNLKVRMHHLE